MTGPEMMLNSLIKLFKLEPYVEVIRQQVKDAADEGWIEKAKNGVNQIATFDERLARIERHLGIAVEPDTSPDLFQPRAITAGDDQAQPLDGANH